MTDGGWIPSANGGELRSNRTLWIVSCWWCWQSVVSSPASAGCCSPATCNGANWVWSANNEITATIGRTLEVVDPAALAVDLPVGSLTVRTGEPGQIAVEATKRAWGRSAVEAQRSLDRIDVSIEPTAAGVRVAVTGPDWQAGASTTPRTPQVDLVVTVPEETQLDLKVGVGRLAVDGVRGDVRITADVGEVELTDVQPVTALEVESGRQHPVRRRLDDRRHVSDDQRRGAHPAATAAGARSRSKRSDIGDATVDFDVIGQQERPGFTGKEITGQVGEPGGTELVLRSRVGDIQVEQAP